MLTGVAGLGFQYERRRVRVELLGKRHQESRRLIGIPARDESPRLPAVTGWKGHTGGPGAGPRAGGVAARAASPAPLVAVGQDQGAQVSLQTSLSKTNPWAGLLPAWLCIGGGGNPRELQPVQDPARPPCPPPGCPSGWRCSLWGTEGRAEPHSPGAAPSLVSAAPGGGAGARLMVPISVRSPRSAAELFPRETLRWENGATEGSQGPGPFQLRRCRGARGPEGASQFGAPRRNQSERRSISWSRPVGGLAGSPRAPAQQPPAPCPCAGRAAPPPAPRCFQFVREQRSI